MVNPGKKLKKILLITGIAGAVYGGFKYLLPLVVPFLFAYALALGMRPSVRFVEKLLAPWKCLLNGNPRRSRAVWIGALELLVILAVLAGVLYFGGSRIFTQLQQFTAGVPQWIFWLDVKLTGICRSLESNFGLRQDYLVSIVRDMLAELGDVIRESSMPALMNNSVAVCSWLIKAVVFLVIVIVAALMFLAEMDEIRERKNQSMFHREFVLIGKRLINVGSAWLKTEAVMVLVTSGLCSAGLFLIGNSYALLIGIGIGLLDALPLFGAGVILIPWGIFSFLQKRWLEGMVLLGLYFICYFARQFLEAKIMGEQVGLTPIETLVSMYVGLQLFGLAGFLLGPIGLLVIQDLVEYYWNEEFR